MSIGHVRHGGGADVTVGRMSLTAVHGHEEEPLCAGFHVPALGVVVPRHRRRQPARRARLHPGEDDRIVGQRRHQRESFDP